MKWTLETPKEQGWHWTRRWYSADDTEDGIPRWDEPEVVLVCGTNLNVQSRLTGHRREWCGPLTPPEEGPR